MVCKRGREYLLGYPLGLWGVIGIPSGRGAGGKPVRLFVVSNVISRIE